MKFLVSAYFPLCIHCNSSDDKLRRHEHNGIRAENSYINNRHSAFPLSDLPVLI